MYFYICIYHYREIDSKEKSLGKRYNGYQIFKHIVEYKNRSKSNSPLDSTFFRI